MRANLYTATHGQGLQQLEPLVMEQLFWAAHPLLASVHPQEEGPARLREQLATSLRAALAPVQQYLDQCAAKSPLSNRSQGQPACCKQQWLHRSYECHPSIGILQRYSSGVCQATGIGNTALSIDLKVHAAVIALQRLSHERGA
jgi:hypothetical protein